MFREKIDFKESDKEMQKYIEVYEKLTKERLDKLQAIKNSVELEVEDDSDDDIYSSKIVLRNECDLLMYCFSLY